LRPDPELLEKKCCATLELAFRGEEGKNHEKITFTISLKINKAISKKINVECESR